MRKMREGSYQMNAKEYLMRYRDAKREGREVELRITKLRLKYEAPGAISYSDMPKAHNNQDLSGYMVELDRLTDLLLTKYQKCLGICTDIEMRLDLMDDQIEREVLRHRYTYITDKGQLTPWDEVGDAVGYSRRSVERIHGQALLNFPVPEEEKKEK